MPAGPKANVRRVALLEVVRAQSLAKDGAGAEKSLAALEEAVKPVAQVAFFASALQNARGLAALARGNSNEAIGAMRKCIGIDFNCQYDLVQAQERAGDRAGAAGTREALFRRPVRAIEYVYVWKKLGGQPGAPRVARSRYAIRPPRE